MKIFSFRSEGFGGGEAGSAPGWGEGGEEASEDHAEGDIKERGVRSVPVDGPTKKSAVDDLHENEGNGETGDEAEGDAGGAEVGGFGHDGAEDLSAGSASGAKDTDFARAFDSQCGQGKSDAERSDSDGEGTEQSSDGKGTIEDAESFVSKTSLRVNKEFPAGAELFAEGVAHGLGGDAGLQVDGEASQSLVLGEASVSGAVEKEETRFGGVVTEDAGYLEGMKAGGSRKGEGTSRLELAAAASP